MQLRWKWWQPVIDKRKVEFFVYPQDHGSESSSTDNWGSENITLSMLTYKLIKYNKWTKLSFVQPVMNTNFK